MENLVGGKKVSLKLVGLDGNAFSLMGAFQGQAKREGWSKDEIMKVMDSCMDGDYNHLVATLSAHCIGGGSGLSEDDEEIEESCDPCFKCEEKNCNGCPHADEEDEDEE